MELGVILSFIIVVLVVFAIVKAAKNADENKSINIDLNECDGDFSSRINENKISKTDVSNGDVSWIKIIGYVVMIIGCVFVAYALFMDVSVVTSNGYRVNNIGLMSSRGNYMVFGGFVFIAGLIVTLFENRKQPSAATTKCPYCAEVISSEAIKCKHCGSDLKSMP